MNRISRLRMAVSLLLPLLFTLGLEADLQAQFFSRVTDAGPIVTDSVMSAGASWTDLNNDGYPDVYACGAQTDFYLNNGDGTFSPVTSGHFVNGTAFSITGIWADYNNDDNIDLYLANWATPQGAPAKNYLYRNVGPADFELDTVNIGTDLNFTSAASWIDFDYDGDVDLFVPGANGSADIFYRNDGNDTFVKRPNLSFLETRFSTAVQQIWVDYDNDADLDLYIRSGGFPNKLHKSLFKETGNPELFEAVSSSELISEGNIFDVSCNWGDYDNDGDWDMFMAVTGTFGIGGVNRLFRNNGDATFTRILDGPVVAVQNSTSFGCWGDYDNDGDLDLFVADVELNLSPAYLYRNEGNGEFVAMSQAEAGDILLDLPAPQAGYWGDYDNDGDLDMFILNNAQPNNAGGVPQPNYLIRNNQGNTNNWLTIRCLGNFSNRSAIGTNLKVKATINGNAVWQMREVSGGTASFAFQPELRAHFGLGDAANVDSLRIEWPSGITQVLENVAVNQFLTVEEAGPTGFVQANFKADTLEAVNSDMLMVQFTDLTFNDPAFPLTSWEWDFDNDGIVEATVPNPSWTYTEADTYSVRLSVSNGINSDTITREDYIKISGPIPIIDVNTSEINLGSIDVNTPAIDTVFYVRNLGGAADSITVSIDPFNVDPPEALSVVPVEFLLAAGDSQAITFTVTPPLLPANGPFLTPRVIVDSRFGYGTVHFEKTIRFRIIGILPVDESSTNSPAEFALEQNYPNPFNPSTIIGYSLPKSSRVTLIVYNMLGEEIRKLVDGFETAGQKSVIWDGRNNSSEMQSSGVYIYRMRAGEFMHSKKTLLLR